MSRGARAGQHTHSSVAAWKRLWGASRLMTYDWGEEDCCFSCSLLIRDGSGSERVIEDLEG
jgi:hypothetical protein